jgi:hypothetical protein
MYILYTTGKFRLYYVFVALLCCMGATATAQTGVPDRSEKNVAVYPGKDSSLPLPPPEGTKAHLYRMNYWVSGGFSLAATAANIYAIPNLITNKSEITDAEIAALNPSSLNGFERWGLEQDPGLAKQLDKTSDYVLQGTVILPALLGLDKAIRKDALRIFVMYYETHALTFTMYNFSFFGPLFQNKYRPITYYSEIPMEDRKSGNNKNSQYSGHTASATAATFFAAKVYNDYHPEFSSAKKYMMYGLASVPPLVQGYLRMKALKHFPSDILIGYLIGATCGVVVPEFHRFKRQAIKYSVVPTPVGAGLGLTWTPEGKRKTPLNTLGI